MKKGFKIKELIKIYNILFVVYAKRYVLRMEMNFQSNEKDKI